MGHFRFMHGGGAPAHYGDGLMSRLEEKYAAGHRDLPARVLITAGTLQEEGLREQDLHVSCINVDPHFDALRSHPRYRSLLDTVGSLA